ncbi:hypothetical protein GS504_05680 [Rhodococcus hoagii]|nr:hypothetical protein [Prescottella equi]
MTHTEMKNAMHPLNVDGASLATSVSAPYGDPPYSTVIIRTPYGIPSKSEQVRQWTRRGYAVVVQDVRGRFASSGRWEPFANETSDGGALIDGCNVSLGRMRMSLSTVLPTVHFVRYRQRQHAPRR